MKLKLSSVLLFSLLFASSLLFAQTGVGSARGSVTDEQAENSREPRSQ